MESEKIAELAYRILDEKKGIHIRAIDIHGLSILADYFIIASGNSRNQVQALADHVEETLGQAGVHARQVEGYDAASWILLDYGSVVIHIFYKEDRMFYDLDRIWKDAKAVEF